MKLKYNLSTKPLQPIAKLQPNYNYKRDWAFSQAPSIHFKAPQDKLDRSRTFEFKFGRAPEISFARPKELVPTNQVDTTVDRIESSVEPTKKFESYFKTIADKYFIYGGHKGEPTSLAAVLPANIPQAKLQPIQPPTSKKRSSSQPPASRTQAPSPQPQAPTRVTTPSPPPPTPTPTHEEVEVQLTPQKEESEPEELASQGKREQLIPSRPGEADPAEYNKVIQLLSKKPAGIENPAAAEKRSQILKAIAKDPQLQNTATDHFQKTIEKARFPEEDKARIMQAYVRGVSGGAETIRIKKEGPNFVATYNNQRGKKVAQISFNTDFYNNNQDSLHKALGLPITSRAARASHSSP